MTPLQDLAARLVVPPHAGRAWPAPAALVALVAQLQQEQQAGPAPLPADACLQALAQFRASGELPSLKQARLACYGLALEPLPGQLSLLEDAPLLDRLLAATERWRPAPLRYRRLYQGLLHSYFAFDPAAGGGSADRQRAALRLRNHLAAHARATVDPQHNPPWVRRVATSPHLFTEAPAAPYADALLRGDTRPVDLLCGELGIAAGSWFRRELVAAQLQAVLALPEAAFPSGIPPVLKLVARQPLLRDDALRGLMDRWAGLSPTRPAHAALMQAARLSWGDPANQPPDPRWHQLGPAARAMFAGWRASSPVPAGPDLADTADTLPAEPAPPQAAAGDTGRPEPAPDAHWRTAEAAHLPFSRANLAIFARAHGLPVDDRSARGEGLWVQVAEADPNVRLVLARWGFAEVPGTGWKR
jgi:EH_Signature domain